MNANIVLVGVSVLSTLGPPRSVALLSARIASKPIPKSVTFEGWVFDPSGKPLPKALVVARPLVGSRSGYVPAVAETDAAGRFRLYVSTPSWHELQIQATGLARLILPRVHPGSPVIARLTKGRTLEGIVRDARTRAGLAGVRVVATEGRTLLDASTPSASRLPRIATTTNKDGYYRLDGLVSGPVVLSASLTNYRRGRRSADTPGRLDMVLFPGGGSISGRVQDPDGRPLTGALILAESAMPPYAPAAPMDSTAEDGGFRLPGLDAATYRLWVRHSGFAPTLISNARLEEGQETRLDVRMSRGALVSGRLVTSDGKPKPGRVRIQEIDGQPLARAATDLLRTEAGADGRFTLRSVPPGVHVAAVISPQSTPKRLDIHVSPASRRLDLGEIVVSPGAEIRGRVEDRARSPVAGASIVARRLSADGGDGDALEAMSEADGSFVVTGVSGGRHRLLVNASGYAEAEVEVRTDEATSEARVVLGPAAALSGAVVDEHGQPVDMFWIALIAVTDRLGRGRPPLNVTNPQGAFVLEDIAPGEYRVKVSAPHRTSSVRSVVVQAGSTVDLGQITLNPGTVLKGTVVDVHDDPVGGAAVVLAGGAQEYEVMMGGAPAAVADVSGAFEIRGLDAGQVELLATHPDYAPGRTLVDVAVADSPHTRIVLSSGGIVRGSARRGDGQSLDGAVVQVFPARPDRPPFGTTPLNTRQTLVQESGDFLVSNVPAGRCRVMLLSGKGSTYTSLRAKEVEVRNGEATVLDFVVSRILVTGHITRAGVPASGMRVSVRAPTARSVSVVAAPDMIPLGGGGPADGPGDMTAVTGADGDYQLWVDEPGTVVFQLAAEDGSVSLPPRVVRIPDEPQYRLSLDFADVRVEGMVIDRVARERIQGAGIVALSRKSGGPAAHGVTNARGMFQLRLQPGDYRVEARAPGYSPAQIEVPLGESSPADLEIELSPGESMGGRVVDESGRAAGGLQIWATTGEHGKADHAVSDMAGKFEFRRLELGSYVLFTGSAEGSFGFRADVAPGQDEVVVILRPGGRIQLRIEDTEGHSVDRARVAVISVDGRAVFWPFSAITDENGMTDIAVPAGLVQLSVSGGGLRQDLRLEIVEGAILSQTVRLQGRVPKPQS